MVQFLYEQRISQLKDMNAWLKTNDLAPYKFMYQKYLEEFHQCVEKVGIVAQEKTNG